MSTVDKLADEVLDVVATEDPLDDVLEGHPGIGHLLGQPGAEQRQHLRQRASELAEQARVLDCDPGDEVTRAVVVQQADAVVTRIDAALVEFSVADYQNSPIGRLLGALPETRPVGAPAEDGFLERLAGIPAYLDAALARHRDGIAAGRLPVAHRVTHAVKRLDGYLARPEDDPLRNSPLSAAAAVRRDRLLERTVRPAFRAYRDAVVAEVLPHGRPDRKPGLCWLPDGEATYAALARMHTTTALSTLDLHRLGLETIEKLKDEYVTIGSDAFGVRTLAAVRDRMRTGVDLRWSDDEQLVATTRRAAARARLAAPAWFGRLPATDCVIQPVTDAGAPSAYYVPPAVTGERPGTCYVNVDQATARGRYLAEATAFHETVPGHHIQFTVAGQADDLPPLRRLAWINAYIEGWGLYAERLADEMGLYSDAVARLGMVAMDSIRAARLVVDTGLHAYGWSRDAAVDFLRDNTVMDEFEIQRETDRYIDMPGQALSYLVGRVEIQRLRDRAQRVLGDRFDVRAFHDVVLGGGALPMDVLDRVVAAWTAARRAQTRMDVS